MQKQFSKDFPLSHNQVDRHSVIVINRPFKQPGFLKKERNVMPLLFSTQIKLLTATEGPNQTLKTT